MFNITTEQLEEQVRLGNLTKAGERLYYVKPHHDEGVRVPPELMACTKPASFDPVDRPEHYTSHPSGVECAAITEHMTCMIGCAIKYLWRHGLKAGADADQDLRKAVWCIERERQRLAKMKENGQ